MRWMAVRLAVFGVSVGLIGGVPDSALSAQEIVEPQPQRVSQFSGKPVPRFETLRYSEVNGRVGPSLEHPVRWRYEREGLPVLIVKESQDWRRIQDPDGEEVWMHARMLRAGKFGMAQTELKLFQTASATSQPIAKLEAGVMVTLLDRSGDWVRVSVDGHRGWALQSAIWGIDPN